MGVECCSARADNQAHLKGMIQVLKIKEFSENKKANCVSKLFTESGLEVILDCSFDNQKINKVATATIKKPKQIKGALKSPSVIINESKPQILGAAD